MNKFVKYFTAISLFLVAISAVASPPLSSLRFKEKDILSVCSYSEFKPISYGRGQGYEADLLRAISRLWGVKIKFYPENIYEGIWRLPSRQYTLCDAAIGGITPTQSRMKENASFSKETTLFEQSLLVRKKDYNLGRINSYASFKHANMKIGVVPGTTGEQYAHVLARKYGLSPSVFVEYPSEAQLVPALLSKKIDAIARGEIGNEYQASLNKNLVTIAKENFHEGFSIAVDSSNQQLLKAFNSAILVVTNNGKISYSQWLHNHAVFMKQVNKLQRMAC